MNSIAYSQELCESFKEYHKAKKDLKSLIIKEIKDILKHSNYQVIEFNEDWILSGYDKDNLGIECSCDDTLVDLVNDYNRVSGKYEKLNVEFFRGRDF